MDSGKGQAQVALHSKQNTSVLLIDPWLKQAAGPPTPHTLYLQEGGLVCVCPLLSPQTASMPTDEDYVEMEIKPSTSCRTQESKDCILYSSLKSE